MRELTLISIILAFAPIVIIGLCTAAAMWDFSILNPSAWAVEARAAASVWIGIFGFVYCFLRCSLSLAINWSDMFRVLNVL